MKAVPHSSRSVRRVGAIRLAAPVLTSAENLIAQAASYPPLQKAQERGTHSCANADVTNGAVSTFSKAGPPAAGELLMGGYGQQGPLTGSKESYIFGGAGGDVNLLGLKASGNISAFISSSPSVGYAAEGGIGKWSGGVGVYANIDNATSCYDHHNL